ncbi:MAG: sporulation integral membrane protein YlbJ [Defluviitaleaceae bacterium]|nr:sporulation integral membrane protein YlbJ [Defluviitaleaceae bacterium]
MKSKIKNNLIIVTIAMLIFNVFIVIFPENIVNASREGLLLWLSNVLPALFPFIFGINLLMSLGITHFFGKYIGFFTKKIFNVPNVSGFAMVVGFTSGYPIGAKIISELREREEITKTQGERLLSFCNNSGPLFILGTVGTAMFQNRYIGIFILITHYISAIITGILFKYYKIGEKEKEFINTKKILGKNYKIEKKENFFFIFTESIVKSMGSMITIGGFIIIFNVVIEIVKISNVIYYLYIFLDNFITLEFLNGLIFGFIEITNGINNLNYSISFANILAVSCIISFGGLSIHAQSISFIAKTDMSIKIYFLGKLIHSFITFFVGIGLYYWFFINFF